MAELVEVEALQAVLQMPKQEQTKATQAPPVQLVQAEQLLRPPAQRAPNVGWQDRQ
jgi:hypothetical protein